MASEVDLSVLSSEEKRRLLEELLAEQETAPEEFQTSFAQDRLWLLDKLTPDNPVYNIYAAVRLIGEIDLELVAESLNLLIERHETLRTVIVERNGVPFQRILQPWQIEVPVISLKDTLRDEALHEIIHTFLYEPFQLSKGPLFRVRFVQTAENNHIALFAMHHAVSDGWSLSVLISEFVTVYTDLFNGRSPKLQPLDIQYADYAEWQKQNSSEQAEQKQLEYWVEQLAGVQPVQLPRDFPESRAASLTGATETSRLSADQLRALKSFAQQRAGTLFMGLLTCLDIVLFKLSGQDDIVVGTPVAGRNRSELEPLIGCFLNTLCLRNRIDGQQSASSHFSSLRSTAITAYSKFDVPFERILSELQSKKAQSPGPLFNVMLNLLSYQAPDLELPGVQVQRFDLPEALAKFDLTIYAEPIGEELELRLVYNSGMFSADRARIMLDQLVAVIDQVTANADVLINDITLCTGSSAKLLDDPSTALEKLPYETVADVIRAKASQHPQAIAIEHRQVQITYQELIEKSQRLACSLCEHSLDSSDVVAVRFEKSIELIVAMVAVQMAGRVMLCIDPTFPDERQQQLLELSKAQVIIDNSGVHATGFAQTERPLHENDSSAYLFFTSGSTGTPKGVLGSAQGLAHFLAWQREKFSISQSDRVAQLTAVSFDVVLRDVFLPLTSGATLCLPPSGDTVLSGEVFSWLDQAKVTVLHSVPSLLRYWLSTDAHGKVKSLKYLFSAGEPLHDSLCISLKHRFPNAKLVNLYGPTETTLAKFYNEIDTPREGVQLVGRPLPNTQVLILNELRRCGVGEVGEIVIRTPYRSLGYLQSSLNRGAFVRNPWSDDSEDLLYRSGDYGRITAQGDLEILGRKDDQIKVRGVRVEIAEVVHAIQKLPQIAECTVQAITDKQGDKQLVAYLVPRSLELTASSIADVVAQAISTSLPLAMHPAHYIVLEKLPLLPNGKIDRKKLPGIESSVQRSINDFAPPLDDLEAALCTIWEVVLPTTTVGRTDNFFRIGGHSLLAAQVVSRIEHRLGYTVPLRSIFENNTVAALAEYLRAGNKSQQLPAIRRRPDESNSPLSLSQEALWFLDRMNPKSGAYTTFPMLRAFGAIDIPLLQQALDTVVQRHEVLRTTFPEVDGQPVQMVAPQPNSTVDYLDLSHEAGPRQEAKLLEWIHKNLSAGIDLELGPIVRLHLARLREQEHVVLIAWHHIIHDGWSLGVLAREILTSYECLLARRPIALPELKIQYADWAVWQRELLTGGYLEKLRQYWIGKLHDVAPLNLITDFPRPSVRTTRGDWCACEIDEGLASGLTRSLRIMV